MKLMVGGYGSGKTYIGSLRGLYLSYLNQGIPGTLVSPSYKQAKKTTIPTIRHFLDSAGLRYAYNKTDAELFIHNWNGHIWFGSGDDPDSLRGPNLAWAMIDEPFIQKRDVFNQMIARVRHPEAVHKEIGLTGTPEALNWGYEVAMNDEGRYDIGVVVAPTTANRYLGEQYVQNLINSYTPEMIEAYVHGKFVNLTQGRVCKPFNRELHVTHLPDLDEVIKSNPVEFGIDFNVDRMSAEIYVDLNGHIHYFDEFRLKNSNTFEISEKIKEKYPGIKCYPDATGSARKSSSTMSDHQILKDAGFIVYSHKGNPPVKDRVNAFNRLLKDNRITIEPGRCPYLVKDLEMMVWKNGDLDQTSDPERTHAFDGGSYPVAYKYPINKREVYQLQW